MFPIGNRFPHAKYFALLQWHMFSRCSLAGSADSPQLTICQRVVHRAHHKYPQQGTQSSLPALSANWPKGPIKGAARQHRQQQLAQACLASAWWLLSVLYQLTPDSLSLYPLPLHCCCCFCSLVAPAPPPSLPLLLSFKSSVGVKSPYIGRVIAGQSVNYTSPGAGVCVWVCVISVIDTAHLYNALH